MAAPCTVSALPPFTGVSLVSQGRLDPFLALVLLLSAALYLYGVYRLRLRGDRWPVGRPLLFLVPRRGVGSWCTCTSWWSGASSSGRCWAWTRCPDAGRTRPGRC